MVKKEVQGHLGLQVPLAFLDPEENLVLMEVLVHQESKE